MIAPVAVAVVVCAAGLVAWRWYLDWRRWGMERADRLRDEVLATLPKRIEELESKAHAAEMAKAFKTR